jgi:hypothetical protein
MIDQFAMFHKEEVCDYCRASTSSIAGTGYARK